MARSKILWVVNYDSLEDFVSKSREVGATGVAIRSDNNLPAAISAFHDRNIKVFAWRWPSAMRDPCMREADKIVDLLDKGLDGYFVDPEGAPGKPYNWDQPGLDALAEEFCRAITSAAPGKPFGTTSHYRGKRTFSNLPWASFFRFSSLLLPQAYWRSTDGTIGHGIPQDNYNKSLQFWAETGGDRAKIVPMAGELAVSTADEIREYANAAAAQNIGDLHFYTHEDGVHSTVWDAVAAA